MDATTPNIYEIAKEAPGTGVASALRTTIARIATEDPRWRQTYDRLIEVTGEEILRHPETVHYPSETEIRYRPVYLTDEHVPVETAAEVLLRQAGLLGVEGCGEDVAVVAAIIAAEVWMAALEADDLAYAAAKGPDAIASAAAILARVSGHGVAAMPLDPDWPSLRFPQENVIQALRHARNWAETQGFAGDWANITAMVVTDLGYFAAGGSKTHEAALLLGVRMPEISSSF
jgi:hypothetical protein